jgi:nicotinamidase-related amidase
MSSVGNDTPTYDELKWNNDPPLYLPPTEYQVPSTPDLNTPPPRIPLHAGNTALLIVDVQPEYWSNAPAVRKDFPQFEENLARTIQICRERKAKIIWVRADYRYHHSPWLAQFERLNGGKRPDTRGELPCNPDDEEFSWEEFATPEGGEAIIAKASWSSTSNTALMDILRVSGVDTVLVCGLITSVCVQHSAFGVFEAGYRTLLVEDACGDRGRARHEAALALYGGYMYELITSKDLDTDLIKAKPVWITMDRVKSNNSLRSIHSTESTERVQYVMEKKRKLSIEISETNEENSSGVKKNTIVSNVSASSIISVDDKNTGHIHH